MTPASLRAKFALTPRTTPPRRRNHRLASPRSNKIVLAASSNQEGGGIFDAIFKHDPNLKPFEGHLQYRWNQFSERKAAIEAAEGSLKSFAKGYDKLGLVKGKDGTITYREWLPAASAVALYGDFNQWNDGSHRLERKEYGVWELTLPAGSIPHKSRFKIRIWKHDGGHVDRLPAWIKYSQPDPSVMGGAFNGIYWDPPPTRPSPGSRPLAPTWRRTRCASTRRTWACPVQSR